MKASAAVVALLAGVPVGAARLQCESTLDCGGCKSAQPGKPLTQDFEDLYNKALADGFTRPMVCQTCQGTLLGPKWCVPTEELTGGRLRNVSRGLALLHGESQWYGNFSRRNKSADHNSTCLAT